MDEKQLTFSDNYRNQVQNTSLCTSQYIFCLDCLYYTEVLYSTYGEDVVCGNACVDDFIYVPEDEVDRSYMAKGD